MAATDPLSVATQHCLRTLIPIDIFWENVYRVDTTKKLADDSFHLKFTFYNDLHMKLPYRFERIGDMDTLVPMLEAEEMEAWKAEAIMKCEAGEEVYERSGIQFCHNTTNYYGPSLAQQLGQQQASLNQQVQQVTMTSGTRDPGSGGFFSSFGDLVNRTRR
jgi:hypothetical protein